MWMIGASLEFPPPAPRGRGTRLDLQRDFRFGLQLAEKVTIPTANHYGRLGILNLSATMLVVLTRLVVLEQKVVVDPASLAIHAFPVRRIGDPDHAMLVLGEARIREPHPALMRIFKSGEYLQESYHFCLE
jgi:hypothetical protein